jgi:hypothetical protein
MFGHNMRLLTLGEVEYGPGDRVFRASGLVPSGLAMAFVAGIAGLIAWRSYAGLPLIVLIPGASVMAGAALIAGASALKSIRRTNWLLICGEGRLLIKFRSYLNTRFPEDDPQVVSIGAGEITAVGRSTLTMRTPDSEGWSEQTSAYLDLSVNCDLSALKEALKHEHRLGRSESTVWQDYPVSVAGDDVIRIEWKSPSARIRPGISVALALLGQYFPNKADFSEALDLTQTGSLDRAEMDSRILDLAERGRKLDAVKLAQTAYGYGLREALDFVEGLFK